jgi:hypothetical protein
MKRTILAAVFAAFPTRHGPAENLAVVVANATYDSLPDIRASATRSTPPCAPSARPASR